jgi:hypothetical protein
MAQSCNVLSINAPRLKRERVREAHVEPQTSNVHRPKQLEAQSPTFESSNLELRTSKHLYPLNNDRKLTRRGRDLNRLQAGLTVAAPKSDAPIDLGVVNDFWLEALHRIPHRGPCVGRLGSSLHAHTP